MCIKNEECHCKKQEEKPRIYWDHLQSRWKSALLRLRFETVNLPMAKTVLASFQELFKGEAIADISAENMALLLRVKQRKEKAQQQLIQQSRQRKKIICGEKRRQSA